MKPLIYGNYNWTRISNSFVFHLLWYRQDEDEEESKEDDNEEVDDEENEEDESLEEEEEEEEGKYMWYLTEWLTKHTSQKLCYPKLSK